ncbi:MAG: molybdate ABC transporter substrate-binding protein [Alphaproteobacteria bacterium]|nr:molybdate ABC transporter substrate-binding protein [Alphaproteobacteria bacterium]
MRASRLLTSIAAFVAALLPLWLGSPARAEDVVVFAAASLKESLDEAARQYQTNSPDKILVSYAASSALAKQIEAGAPADVFISADLEWMDYLATRNLIKPATRADLLGNTLVLIAPKDSTAALKLAPGTDLAAALKGGKLAMGDPDHVPAGKYGKAALEKLGIWASVQNSVARAENVRSALAFLARGEAPLGIVYGTDAAAEKAVKIVDTFPAGSYPPIIYPVAETASGNKAGAARFVAFLRSADGKAVFQRYGFLPAP